MSKFQMLKWAKDFFPICRSITGVENMTIEKTIVLPYRSKNLSCFTKVKKWQYLSFGRWNIKLD